MSSLVVVGSLLVFFAVAFVFAPFAAWVAHRAAARAPTSAEFGAVDSWLPVGLQSAVAASKRVLLERPERESAAAARRHLALFGATVPPLAAFAVIPFGGTYVLGQTTLSLVAADLDWGVLTLLAAGALGIWLRALAVATSDPASLAAGLQHAGRAAVAGAAIGLTLVPMLLVFGTLKLSEMGQAQDTTFALLGWLGSFDSPSPVDTLLDTLAAAQLPRWGILLQPAAFGLFLISALGPGPDVGRMMQPGAARDAHAGGEPVVGSSGLVAMGRPLETVVIAGLVTVVFLGGWAIPYLSQSDLIGFVARFYGEEFATLVCMAVHVGSFVAKMGIVIVLLERARTLLLRPRLARFAGLGGLLAVSIANVLVTAVAWLAMEGRG